MLKFPFGIRVRRRLHAEAKAVEERGLALVLTACARVLNYNLRPRAARFAIAAAASVAATACGNGSPVIDGPCIDCNVDTDGATEAGHAKEGGHDVDGPDGGRLDVAVDSPGTDVGVSDASDASDASHDATTD
jgi:hypothetical protein